MESKRDFYNRKINEYLEKVDDADLHGICEFIKERVDLPQLKDRIESHLENLIK